MPKSDNTPRNTVEDTHIIFEFKTENAKKTFEFLISAFIEDYMLRKLFLEKSGWRTFPAIIKHGRISKIQCLWRQSSKGKSDV